MARYRLPTKAANCAASITCAKTVRVAAVRADVRLVRGVVVMPNTAELRVVVEVRTLLVATTSRPRRTAMIVRRAVPAAVLAAVIAVGPAARTLINRVRIRRVRTMQVRRVVRASRMDKAVRRARAALLHTPATAPNSAAGTCPKASTPARARCGPAAIRIQRIRSRDVPARAARANLVVQADSTAMARHARKANMPDQMSSARSRRVRTAIALAVNVRKAIVRKAACHAARTPAPVVTARKALAPVAIVRAAIIRVGSSVAPAARRRTRVHMARALIARTHRAVRKVRVTKDCRATRIDPRVFPTARMQCGRRAGVGRNAR